MEYKNILILMSDFTILKESVVYKEYEIYYGFMVCSTDLHAVFKTEKSRGGEPRRSEVAGAVLSKVGAGCEPARRAARAASIELEVERTEAVKFL
ncbi:hypothetical protein AVEN_89118-1 [Araneus ventricosus]|uniref:Uncharacterized protein n=1 Tax=Araneus ventricosus TaxID=182803 RepID=A0A4Y2B1W2_ARAVE|nr:hypothetical protein AVEN_89118-1 [Araneus ventricosus]